MLSWLWHNRPTCQHNQLLRCHRYHEPNGQHYYYKRPFPVIRREQGGLIVDENNKRKFWKEARHMGTEKGAEIVFIDPGHGGHDPGRLRKDGDYNTI